jgi:AraC-like DNA-binding protein
VYRRVKDVILEFLSANQPLKMAGLMLELLNEIASGLTQPASSAGAHVRALRRAAQEIIAKPEAELDISALARGANLSPSHFRKLFRETHRQSPRTLHDRVRMQKACELVLHSGYNVSQVAEELGFSSVHNFSRAFKRIVGVSPRAYQRKMLEVK